MSGFVNLPQVPFPGSLDIVSKLAPELAREKPPPTNMAEPAKPLPDMEYVLPHPQQAEFAHLNRHVVGDAADESRSERLLGHHAVMAEVDRMVEPHPDLQPDMQPAGKQAAAAASAAQELPVLANNQAGEEDVPSAYVESGFGSDAGQ